MNDDLINRLLSRASQLDNAGDGMGYYSRADALLDREAANEICALKSRIEIRGAPVKRVQAEALDAQVAKRAQEAFIRAAAVAAVDAIYGYTMEFSSQPAQHRHEYDIAESAIRGELEMAQTRLRAALPEAPAVPVGEPDAWQYRYKHKTSERWSKWGNYDPALAGYSDLVKEKRPLYAALVATPPAPTVDGAARDLLASLDPYYLNPEQFNAFAALEAAIASPAPDAMVINGSPIAEFVRSYQFDASDEGAVYTPNHNEQCLIEDAICSFISDDALLSAALKAHLSPGTAEEEKP